MIFQPRIDLLRPSLMPALPKLRPKLLEPVGSQWALDFNGTSGYINCGNDATLEPDQWTVGAWINPDGLSGSRGIISRGVGGWGRDYYYMFFTSGTKLVIIFGNGATQVALSWNGVIVINKWQFVVATLSSLFLRLYVNSVEAPSSPVVRTISPDIPTATTTIGALNQGNSYYCNGQINLAFIYNRAISAAEIFQFYLNPYLPPDSRKLVGWWRFQEGYGVANGTEIRDWSGQGNHGSMQNFSGNPWANIGIR